MILAIDPGPTQSAWVSYNGALRAFGLTRNEDVLENVLPLRAASRLVIEMVASYGMPVGRDVFETVLWTGRFIQAADMPHELMYRRDVKLHLCNSARAKDRNVRQALLDRFARTGGGAVPQLGTKQQPGPLYGVSRDVWAALAVAVTWTEQSKTAA